MTRLLLTLNAAACSSAALVVWFTTRIGPVVWLISDRGDHGLHLGDLLVGLPLALAAVVSAVAARSRP
jgi:hypothetical protein